MTRRDGTEIVAMTTIRVIVLAHVANGAGWLLAAATPLLVQAFGKPGFAGFVLAMPFFAGALWLYNAAAPRPAAEGRRESA